MVLGLDFRGLNSELILVETPKIFRQKSGLDFRDLKFNLSSGKNQAKIPSLNLDFSLDVDLVPRDLFGR